MLKKVLMTLAILFIVVASLIGYGIYRFFNQFGDPVNEELSDSYYYSRDNKSIIYSPMGNWFELGKNAMEVDMASFQVLSRDYAKDKNHAYFKSRAIDFDIDVPSFKVKFRFIPMDKNHVYLMQDDLYYLHDTKEGFAILEGADPETYEQLNYDFAKDQHSVYMNNKKVPEVDPKTFEVLNDYFSKDKNEIYSYVYDEPLLTILGNPLETIRLSSYAIRDDQTVYIALDGGNQIVNLTYQDSTKIRAYDGTYLLRVDDRIYLKEKWIEEADADTFEIIGDSYYKDQHKVFYQEQYIKEADVSSFQLVEYGYAKDEKHVFFLGKLVEGADPSTFRYNELKYQFQDKKYVYESGERVGKK